MRVLIVLCCLFCISAPAQLKSYTIGVRGDTLNGIDKNDKKQGKWVVRHDEVRGEPGFEEEGTYINDRKEGTWRKFTLMGDQFAVENYHWGFKDGPSMYFNINGDLLREESWRAAPMGGCASSRCSGSPPPGKRLAPSEPRDAG